LVFTGYVENGLYVVDFSKEEPFHPNMSNVQGWQGLALASLASSCQHEKS
jgi:hypothetical protein